MTTARVYALLRQIRREQRVVEREMEPHKMRMLFLQKQWQEYEDMRTKLYEVLRRREGKPARRAG